MYINSGVDMGCQRANFDTRLKLGTIVKDLDRNWFLPGDKLPHHYFINYWW